MSRRGRPIRNSGQPRCWRRGRRPLLRPAPDACAPGPPAAFALDQQPRRL